MNNDPQLLAMKRMTATLMILEARHAALSAFAIDALEKLGAQATNHPDIQSALQHMERKRCDDLLSRFSDDDPAFASEMKRIIDQMSQR